MTFFRFENPEFYVIFIVVRPKTVVRRKKSNAIFFNLKVTLYKLHMNIHQYTDFRLQNFSRLYASKYVYYYLFFFNKFFSQKSDSSPVSAEINFKVFARFSSPRLPYFLPRRVHLKL